MSNQFYAIKVNIGPNQFYFTRITFNHPLIGPVNSIQSNIL